MRDTTFGNRLKSLRSVLGKNQKDFAEYVNIPQPSLSAYENDKNSPTLDVLIQIADKCGVSIDWLCGRTNSTINITNLSDIVDVLFQISETNEIGCEITIHDKIENGLDLETANETDDRYRWWTQLKFYGNDKDYPYNADICCIIKKVNNIMTDLKSFGLSKEDYEIAKEHAINHYSLPLTQKQIPNLSRKERLKKHLEYLKENEENEEA